MSNPVTPPPSSLYTLLPHPDRIHWAHKNTQFQVSFHAGSAMWCVCVGEGGGEGDGLCVCLPAPATRYAQLWFRRLSNVCSREWACYCMVMHAAWTTICMYVYIPYTLFTSFCLGWSKKWMRRLTHYHVQVPNIHVLGRYSTNFYVVLKNCNPNSVSHSLRYDKALFCFSVYSIQILRRHLLWALELFARYLWVFYCFWLLEQRSLCKIVIRNIPSKLMETANYLHY